MDDKPIGAIWRPVRDLAPEYHGYSHEGARKAAARWRQARKGLEDPKIDRSSMDIWLREQKRAFAIETGQIEGLYLLRRGVTETLITEGFDNVRAAHTVDDVGDETIKGLLQDQEAALEMMFAHVRDEWPLTTSSIKEWHALLTRHQATATGIDVFGRRVEIPLLKGEWKTRPNNPRRTDGHVHEYCPPEQVGSEMDRFLELHAGHAGLGLAPETEAAWLHHEFVRIHPFQDGNGRISRLLMAYACTKAGEFPPVIATENKFIYFDSLNAADEGRFDVFVDYLGNLTEARSTAAAVRAERILEGHTSYRHGNGGITSSGVYYPPEDLAPGPDPRFANDVFVLSCAVSERVNAALSVHGTSLPQDIEEILLASVQAGEVPEGEVDRLARRIARRRAETDLRVAAAREIGEGEHFEVKVRFGENPSYVERKHRDTYEFTVARGMGGLDRKAPEPTKIERRVARAAVAVQGTERNGLALAMVEALERGTMPPADDIRAEREAAFDQLREGAAEMSPDGKRSFLRRLYRSFTGAEIVELSEGRGAFLERLPNEEGRAKMRETLLKLHSDVTFSEPSPWRGRFDSVARAALQGTDHRRGSEQGAENDV